MSDDPEQEYFADGMVEEIITAPPLVKLRLSAGCFKSSQPRDQPRDLSISHPEHKLRSFSDNVARLA
jgi:hypothetical protein